MGFPAAEGSGQLYFLGPVESAFPLKPKFSTGLSFVMVMIPAGGGSTVRGGTLSDRSALWEQSLIIFGPCPQKVVPPVDTEAYLFKFLA